MNNYRVNLDITERQTFKENIQQPFDALKTELSQVLADLTALEQTIAAANGTADPTQVADMLNEIFDYEQRWNRFDAGVGGENYGVWNFWVEEGIGQDGQ